MGKQCSEGAGAEAGAEGGAGVEWRCPVHTLLAVSSGYPIEKGSLVGLLSKRLFSCLFGCGRTGSGQDSAQDWTGTALAGAEARR